MTHEMTLNDHQSLIGCLRIVLLECALLLEVMHDIALLKDDPLVNFLELLGHLEVQVSDLVQLDLYILLLGCPLDLLHL